MAGSDGRLRSWWYGVQPLYNCPIITIIEQLALRGRESSHQRRQSPKSLLLIRVRKPPITSTCLVTTDTWERSGKRVSHPESARPKNPKRSAFWQNFELRNPHRRLRLTSFVTYKGCNNTTSACIVLTCVRAVYFPQIPTCDERIIWNCKRFFYEDTGVRPVAWNHAFSPF